MKKLFLLINVFITLNSIAQNVGIGTSDPKSKLDITGGLSLREGPVLTLVNGGASGGANDNVVLPDISTGVKASFYRVTGPTAAFSLFGIAPTTGADGQLVTLVNTTSEVMTIKHNASSTVTNGFKISGGNDLVSVAGGSSVTIQYNKTDARWYVTASQNFLAPSNGVANISVTAPITTTGGANPTIGLGLVPVDKGGTGLTAVGAGQVLIGTSGGGYLNTTLSSGNGINVVSNSGSVTIENTGDTNAGDDITTNTSAGGDLTGNFPNPTVVGIQGRPVASTAPTNGQTLIWNNTLSKWEPGTPTGGTVTGTGNATEVAFWNSNTGLSSDANLYWNNSTKSLGLGTNAPAEQFEIKSALPVQTFHNPGQASYKLGDDGNVFKIAAMDNGYGGHGGSFANNDVQVLSMTTTGNVGVGNVAPQHQLSIGAATGDNQTVTVRGYSNSPSSWKGGAAFGYTSASVIMGELNGAAQIGGHSATLNAWANLLLNSAAGNVGVRTTSPLAKLSIGAGSLADDNLPVQISTGGTATESYYGVNKNGAYGLLLGYVNGTGLGTKALIRNITSDPLSFYVNNTTEAMTILNNGNVGVGVSPGEKLDVSANIRASGIVYWGNGLVRTETRTNAGLRGDAGARSGFFETDQATAANNYPTGSSSWWHLLDVRHSNNANNYAMQFAGSFYDQNLWFRKTNDNPAQPWLRVLTTNDIPGGNLPTGSTGQTLYHNGTSWTATSNLYNNGSQINLGQFTTGNTDEWPYVTWLRDLGANWDEGLIKGDNNRGVWNKTGFGIHMHSSRHFGFYSTGWDPLFDIEGGSGRTYIKGNTGVGTSSPAARLTVSQSGSHEVAHFIQASPTTHNNDVWWKGGAGADWLLSKRTTDLSGDFWIYNPTFGNSVLTLKQNGSVGINNTLATNTGAMLSITPTGGNWNEGIEVNPAPGGFNAIFFRQTANSITNSWFLGKINNNNFGLLRNSLSGMTGTSRSDQPFEVTTTGNTIFGGNVGIGVSPAYKLDVNGNLNVTGGGRFSGTLGTQYGGSYRISANADNFTGGGISVADDGGFYDYNDAWVTFNGSTGLRIAGNNGPASTVGSVLRVNGLSGNGNRLVSADAGGVLNVAGAGINLGGQTTNGASHYQWEGATYRNPGDHTPTLLLRADNPTTGVNGFRPALTLYNFNGAQNSTVGMVFASNEAAGVGNTVNLAGIMAVKESAGNDQGWSAGGLQFFTKNFGTRVDALGITAAGRVNVWQATGADPVFTGLEDPTSAEGRAQVVLSSSYSDLVIASRHGNDAHGSTLTFATYNPADANDYRKFVINQGNWGARRGFLDFGFADAGGRTNPHSNINGSDNVMVLDGFNKRVGIGTQSPRTRLEVNGSIVQRRYNEVAGSYGIGTYYEGATGEVIAGLEIEHANVGGTYAGDFSNRVHIRTHLYNGGWDRRLTVDYNGNVGIGTTGPEWKLHIEGGGASSILVRQNGNHSYGIVEGLETYDNGAQTQDGPRIGFHKRGAKTWATGIEPYGSNGFGIWEDGYNGQWGTERFTVVPGGNVGIGNTNPATKLDVTGDITAATGVYGDVNIGKINTTQIPGGNAPITSFLNFRGNYAYNNPWDSDNSDPLWMARCNYGNNSTALEISLGDDNSNADVLNVGYTQSNIYYPKWWAGAAGGYGAYSDERLKKDIVPLTNVLNKITTLRAVTYRWKEQNSDSTTPIIGFIAQDIQKVFPEMVDTGERGMLRVNHGAFPGLFIQAIKEQQQQIDELKKGVIPTSSNNTSNTQIIEELNEVKNQNRLLQEQLNAIKIQLEELKRNK